MNDCLCGAYKKQIGCSNISFFDLYETLLKPRLSKQTISAGFYPFGNARDGDNTVVPTYVQRHLGEVNLSRMYPSLSRRQKALEGNSFLVRLTNFDFAASYVIFTTCTCVVLSISDSFAACFGLRSLMTWKSLSKKAWTNFTMMKALCKIVYST